MFPVDIGTQIQHYKIVEHIGRGGMADVWSARDTSLGRMVAIKTIARDLSAEGANPVDLFQREARTIANIEHPHILPIYGFGDYVGKLYIVMRLVTGGSLEDMLRRGALTYPNIITIGRAMADALSYAHTEKIIHLDLKPPNILLDSKGSPYLADFGLATVLGPEGRARNPGSGTLLYMAPEQLTSDELDHRADIYSFSLMLFHMLTGRLPFDATMPLALKQIQWGENLPYLGDLNPNLPDDLTDILRKGTAPDPTERYDNVSALMQDVEGALGVSALEGTVRAEPTPDAETLPFVDVLTLVDPKQIERHEAQDIYQKARQAWANGNGRFLLSVTHFMVMSDFYLQAEANGLSYDDAGAQMLLRGALEYDYQVDAWWSRLDLVGRRWVCLHTLRSENPQARIRALYRLETLTDATPPQIPQQVAQALSMENNEQVMLAALRVLAARAYLMYDRQDFDVKTEFRERLLDTLTRDSLQLRAADTWLNVTYSQEIDLVVADAALNGQTPAIRAAAARAVGRMRSTRAVNHIVKAGQGGARGASVALGYVLDEIPTLPPSVPFVPRFVAWLLNTRRRLTENPMQIVWAFVFAMMGGWLGMGQHVYQIFRSQQIFLQQRILNVVAVGLSFGFVVGVLTVVSYTLPKRLKGFWPNWTRLIWSAVSAYYLSQLIWWAYVWMLLNLDSPPKDILVITGIGTAVGFVLPTMFKMRGWQAFLLTVVTTFAVHWLGFVNFWRGYIEGGEPLQIFWRLAQVDGQWRVVAWNLTYDSWIFAYERFSQVWTVLLPLVIFFALGVHAPALAADVRALWRWWRIGRHLPQGGGTASTPTASVARAAKDDAPKTVRLMPMTPKPAAPAPATERLAQDADLKTALKPLVPLDAVTEEFEIGKVGGRDEPLPPPTDWDALLKPLDAVTEEFEIGKVGGRDATPPTTPDISSDPDLKTTLKPLLPTDAPPATDAGAPNMWDMLNQQMDALDSKLKNAGVSSVDEDANDDAPPKSE